MTEEKEYFIELDEDMQCILLTLEEQFTKNELENIIESKDNVNEFAELYYKKQEILLDLGDSLDLDKLSDLNRMNITNDDIDYLNNQEPWNKQLKCETVYDQLKADIVLQLFDTLSLEQLQKLQQLNKIIK